MTAEQQAKLFRPTPRPHNSSALRTSGAFTDPIRPNSASYAANALVKIEMDQTIRARANDGMNYPKMFQ
jgi:hypothetical protein